MAQKPNITMSDNDSARQQIDEWLNAYPNHMYKMGMQLLIDLLNQNFGDYVAVAKQLGLSYPQKYNYLHPSRQSGKSLTDFFSSLQQSVIGQQVSIPVSTLRSSLNGISWSQAFPSPSRPSRTSSGWWVTGESVSCTSEGISYIEQTIGEREAYHAQKHIHGAGPHDSQPDQKIPHQGLVVGELDGWRLWRVKATREGLRLISQAMDTVWEPKEMMEGSLKAKPMYPGTDPGVYVWKTREAVEFHLTSLGWNNGVRNYDIVTDSISFYPFVIGRARLWGEVVEHEYGYRAERAEVKSLERLYGWKEMRPGPASQVMDSRGWTGRNAPPGPRLQQKTHWSPNELLRMLQQIYLPVGSGDL